MRWLCAIPLLALGPSAFGQAKPDPKRIAVIWTAAENRMVRQSDFWFESGEFLRSINLLRVIYYLNPTDYEIATDLGWMYENVDRYPEALKIYQEFRKNNPKNPDAPYPEANYYFVKKQYDKVYPLLLPSLANKPHPNSFRICAHSLDRSGKLKESKAVWEALLKLSPEDRMAEANLRKVENKINKGGNLK